MEHGFGTLGGTKGRNGGMERRRGKHFSPCPRFAASPRRSVEGGNAG